MNTENFLPNIYLNKHMKQALLLQLVSKEPINILFVGDPYSGKTTILQEMAKQKEKATFCNGILFTKILTPTNVLIKETMNNTELLCVDDVDSCTAEDRMVLKDILNSKMSVLAVANPKFGRFDPYDLIANQINLPPTLINRFDLIFPIKDMPGREKDEKMASFILSLHKDPESAVFDIPTDLLRKFFAYVRQKANPQMSDEAIEELKEYYVKMRNSGASDEAGIKSIPITARQLEALVRLSEASAKIRLSKTVDKEDARKSIELIDYCLNQIAKDSETGKIDIDRLSSRITASQRGGISTVKEIISALEEQTQSKIIPVEQIVEAAQEKQISPEKTEEALEKLRRSGDIFEPKRGFIQKL